MKHIYFFIFFSTIIFVSYIQAIDTITNITYNRLLMSYNDAGHLTRYENRLFTNNMNKTTEYMIGFDGSLDLIMTHETVRATTTNLIDENNLYSFHNKNDTNYMSIFDMSTIPMTLTHSFPIPIINSEYITRAFAVGDIIYIQDYYSGTIRFNKSTLSFIEPLIDFTAYVVKDFYFIKPYEHVENGLFRPFIRFFDSTLADAQNPWGIVIYDLILEIDGVRDFINFKVEGDYLYAFLWGYIGIFDISDINNIHTVYEMHQPDEWLAFTDATLYENYLFVSHSRGIIFYDVTYFDNPNIIHQREWPFAQNISNSFHIFHDFLYTYEYFYTGVYDINNNFNQIQKIGVTGVDVVSSSMDYIVLNYFENSIVEIVPIFDDTTDRIIVETNLEPNTLIGGLEITDDFLFIVSFNEMSNLSNFSVYNFTSFELIHRSQIPFWANSIRFLGDHIIFQQQRENQYPLQHIYKLENLNIQHVETFVGYISTITGYDPDDYFSVLTSNRIEFRSKSDPTSILFYRNLFNVGMHTLEHVANGVLSYQIGNRQYFYKYDEGFVNFTQTYNLNIHTTNVRFYKGYMTVSSGSESTISKFYAIENGIPRLIGELDKLATTFASWISLEHNGLVVQTGGAWHFYDIDYTLSSIDISNEAIPFINIIGNQPNPFNPITSIVFTLQKSSFVSIDIYNIRGQKVKNLINEEFSNGKNIVVWDGTDNNSNVVSSGVYFYRIISGDFNETRRMVLLK